MGTMATMGTMNPMPPPPPQMHMEANIRPLSDNNISTTQNNVPFCDLDEPEEINVSFKVNKVLKVHILYMNQQLPI